MNLSSQRHRQNSTRHMRKYFKAALSAAVLISINLFCCEPAFAARLLQVHVECDGQLVVHTYYDDAGRADGATVWRYLGRQPIMVEEETVTVEPDAEAPLQATLNGDILVKFSHGDRVLAQAELSRLTLIRPDAQSSMWFLPGQEVERTATIAALGPPSALPEMQVFGISGLVGLSLLLVVFLTVAVGAAFRVRRARASRET